jgi:capsular polysaccharide transport system permease protein
MTCASLAMRPRILAALIVRETLARFGTAWGGYLWAFLEPLGGSLLLALAFSFIVQSPPLGDSFLFFYATGLIPFLMYNAVAAGAMNAISMNRGLLAYPVISALDTILARALLDALTYVVIAVVLIFGLAAVLGLPLPEAPGAFAASLALAAMLGLGVGTFNALLVGVFPAWRQVWSVLNRPLFIVSGILFIPDSAPEGLAAAVWWNPVQHVVAEMRAAFFGPGQSDPAGGLYTFAVSAALFAVGGGLIRRHQGRLIQG